MVNMGYCRFQNTLADLRDCEEHMDDVDLSEDERVAFRSMIKLCNRIASDHCEDYGA